MQQPDPIIGLTAVDWRLTVVVLLLGASLLHGAVRTRGRPAPRIGAGAQLAAALPWLVLVTLAVVLANS
jgi:hypothetical protein